MSTLVTTEEKPLLTIRPFSPEDYETFVALHNVVENEHPITVEEMRYDDENRNPKCFHARLLAERGGEIVGWGTCGHDDHMYHPQKFWVDVRVHPDYRRQGIGGTLYDALIATLEPFSPILLRVGCRESRVDALRFLTSRGFTEEERAWESRLDPQRFDPSPYEHLAKKLRAQGIEIKSLAELEGDPDLERRLYELDWEVSQDVPVPEPLTKPDYETWLKHTFKSPNLLPEAFLVAVSGNDYAGLSVLWNSQSGDGLYNGITGVARAHRRKGVALALKVKNLVWAKERGYTLIRTWNNTLNRPMLSINEKLGFEKQPADIGFKKEIRHE
jgi:mycothiol synthase